MFKGNGCLQLEACTDNNFHWKEGQTKCAGHAILTVGTVNLQKKNLGFVLSAKQLILISSEILAENVEQNYRPECLLQYLIVWFAERSVLILVKEEKGLRPTEWLGSANLEPHRHYRQLEKLFIQG